MLALLALLTSALAAEAPVTVHEEVVPIPGDIDPDQYDALLEEAVGRAPLGVDSVRLVDPGGEGIEARLPRPADVPDKEPWAPLTRAAADNPGEASGFLSGREVYLSQCHGWIWYDSLGRFATQRGNNWDTVEDFHNPEGMNQFLARYLENAGARVFTTGERDHNANMVIVDDGDPDYSETGSGFTSGPAGYGARATFAYGENPFDLGGTRSFPASGGAVASWSPDVPEAGIYAVYVSWDSDPGNATDAHYRITHPGGVIDRTYDQTVHGSTWQYVDELWLEPGHSLTVELIGDAGSGSLSADAVRIGGGMGNVTRNGVTTGMPRWQEGAILYTQFNGAPTSIYDPFFDGDGSDPTSRSRWAEWEHPSGADAVYLSWHSNAFDGNARGTITYFAGGGSDAPSNYPASCDVSGPAVDGSYSLARAVQDEIMSVIYNEWDPNWQDRGLGTSCFSEVSPGNNDEMPAALVELAFHDNDIDALHLKHPLFRRHAARGMYRGIVRYFAERDGLAPVFLPEPPVAPALIHDANGNLFLTWKAGPSGGDDGDAADRYRVHLSRDGRAWDSGTEVSGTAAWVAVDPGTTVFARVVGLNAGGESFPSEVVGGRRSPDGSAPVLVVGAFDRLDRGMLEWEYAHSSLGDVVRMNLHRMNQLDIVAPFGRAIGGAGWYFDGVSDEAAAELGLDGWQAVVWAAGEESTADESFSDSQQAQVEAYWAAGGALWVSGAEVLWDLDSQGSATDQAFAANVLGAGMEFDAAGSNEVDGEGVLAGVGPMDFGAVNGGPYPVEWPDTLSTSRPVVARYASGEVAGALGDGVATFGFPFDAMVDPDVQVQVAGGVLGALLPGVSPPVAPDGGGDLVVLTEDPGPTGTGPTTETPGSEPGAGSSPRVPIEPTAGCGCDAGAPAGMAGGFLVLFALGIRRR